MGKKRGRTGRNRWISWIFASFINQSTMSASTFCQSELKDSESTNKIPLSFIAVIITQYITTLNDCQLN